MDLRRYLITIAATAVLAIGIARVAADKPLTPTAATPAGEVVQITHTAGTQAMPAAER